MNGIFGARAPRTALVAISRLRIGVLVMALAAIAQPASAQWTRIAQVPAAPLYSVSAKGDTILASGDSTVFVSTDAGVTWRGSSKVTTGGLQVQRAVMRNGRIYAGTRGKGVFVSADLGSSWSDFNQGLVGGFADSQLAIIDVLIRGDSIYVATEGSGAWVRNLKAGTWQVFGNVFEPAQAANMTFITAGGSRLLAGGGFNGTVYFRDPGQTDWPESLLFNDRLGPGIAAVSAIWTGSRWVVGSTGGVFVSAQGQSPWTFVDPGAGFPLFIVPLAMHGRDLLAGFGSRIAVSHDDGSNWQLLESVPLLASGFAVLDNTLYASRLDGLWRRDLRDLAAVPPPEARLSFAIAGAQLVRNVVRFRFDLPAPCHAAIDVFDLAGRHVSAVVAGFYEAGSNQATWNASALPSGVYYARLSAGPRTETVRFVRMQ